MPTNVAKLSAYDLRMLATGILKYCPNQTFFLSGQTITSAQASSLVASVAETVDAVTTAAAVLVGARQDAKEAVKRNGTMIKAIRDMLGLMFSTDVAALEQLGIPPRKTRTPLTTEQLLVANARAKATRKARGTKGKKQRKAIKGGVTGVVIEPVVAGSTGGEPEGTASGG
jgi:hypothetical protein